MQSTRSLHRNKPVFTKGGCNRLFVFMMNPKYAIIRARIPKLLVRSWRIGISRIFHDRPFFFSQGIHQFGACLEVFLNQWMRGQCHPLIQRHIFKAVASEHLEKPQTSVTGVLDVMAKGTRHISDVACPIIEGAGCSFAAEDRHSSCALDIILLLVRVWMPVQFSHTTWFDLYQCRRDPCGDRKIGRVNDADGTSRENERFLFHQAV